MNSPNKVQKDYLKKRRSQITKFREKVIDKYTPAIFENIKQIRSTLVSLSITSGAIAAFSLNLFDKEFVVNKQLLLMSLVLFLIVVWLGYYYLISILKKENERLTKSTDKYNTAITKVRESIDKLENEFTKKNIKKLSEAEKELLDVFGEEQEVSSNWIIDNAGYIMFALFTLALILIIFSFVNLTSIQFNLLS